MERQEMEMCIKAFHRYYPGIVVHSVCDYDAEKYLLKPDGIRTGGYPALCYYVRKRDLAAGEFNMFSDIENYVQAKDRFETVE